MSLHSSAVAVETAVSAGLCREERSADSSQGVGGVCSVSSVGTESIGARSTGR